MPAFPLSLRLLGLPLWGGLHLRAGWIERSEPLLTLHVSANHPLPAASALDQVGHAPVAGLWLRLEGVHAGWATLSEVRAALLRLRVLGKQIICELVHAGNAEMYLASVASVVYLHPMTSLNLLGVGASLRFAGTALSRLGVRFDMEAAGAYKSAGETFTRAFATPENREAITEVVADLQDELEQVIAEGRGISVEEVREAMAAAPLSGPEALERKLVDGLRYPDGVEREIGEDVDLVPFWSWWRARARAERAARWIEGRPRVVVLHLTGPVVDGEGTPGAEVIASGQVVEVLEALREDDRITGVVLHIHSPGGSATASDLIWRAASRLGEVRPVVAAMGDVAASGGYYIAVAATRILAWPTTLTGSIGVVGGKFVVGDALGRLGVYSEAVVGAPHADFFSLTQPFDDSQRRRFRDSLTHFYRGFVDRVAAGRRQPVAAIEPVAQGRVWSGRRALEVGLIDAFGGVREAVAEVAKLAGVESPTTTELSVAPRGSRIGQFVRRFLISSVPELKMLPAVPPSLHLLQQAQAGQPLLWWPMELEIR